VAKHEIKRGVSLDSFQEVYFLRTLDLEPCIAISGELGATGIESLAEVMEAAAPLAAERGVWLGLEVHAPWDFEHEWIQRHLEVANRVGADTLGVIPDMGAFARRFPRVMYERSVPWPGGGRDEKTLRIRETA
jgi:hypothetical protein